MYYYNQPTSQYWAIHQPLATVRVRPVGLQEIIHMHPQAFYSVVVEVLRIINLTPIKDSEIVRLDKVCPCLSISVKMQDYNSLLYVLVSSRTATLQRYQPLLCPLWVKPQSLPPSLSSTSLSLSFTYSPLPLSSSSSSLPLQDSTLLLVTTTVYCSSHFYLFLVYQPLPLSAAVDSIR